jgi:hypothetical protein
MAQHAGKMAVLLQAWKRFRSVAAATDAEAFPADRQTWPKGIPREKAGIVMGATPSQDAPPRPAGM